MKGQGRYTAEELSLIRDVFKSNERLLKLVRKIFLPEITPENLKDIQSGHLIDIYSSISPDRSPEDVVTDVKARNLLISHLNVQLNNLELMANTEEKTPEQQAETTKKNSAK